MVLWSDAIISHNLLVDEPGQASLGFHCRSCSFTPWFLSRQHPSYPTRPRDPKESLSWLLEAAALLGAPGVMGCRAQLPLDSESTLENVLLLDRSAPMRRGQHQKSCYQALLQWTQSLWRHLCEFLSVPSFHPCFAVFKCWWPAIGGSESHSPTLNSWAKSVMLQCCDSCTK